MVSKQGNATRPIAQEFYYMPLKFKDEISQPLAVFDYDKNRNYRFLVTQGSDLLMYNGKGKQVKGFSYNSKSKIKTSPKHMRFKSKDYRG